jgi:uncharacterized membrane protein (UPF0127 family)
LKVFLIRSDNVNTLEPGNANDLKIGSARCLRTDNIRYSKIADVLDSEINKVQQFQKDKDLLIFQNIEVARSFFTKLAGLIFKKELKGDEGLLFENCNSIHTLWMRFPIDVLFLDGENMIVSIIQDLRPFRFSPFIKQAVKVIEIKAGVASEFGLRTGDIFRFE